MATISKIVLPNNAQYNLQDKISGYTTNTGTVTSVTAGTGLKIGSATSGGSITGTGTINHINSVTAGTVGTSSATSGSTLAVPYITYDAQGHITATGTHTHTITGSGLQNLKDGNATASVRGTQTSTSIGEGAFQTGFKTEATGRYSHAEGYGDIDSTTHNWFDPSTVYPKVIKGYVSTVRNPNEDDPYEAGYYIYTLHITEGKITDVFVTNKITVIEPNKLFSKYDGDSAIGYYDFKEKIISYINYETGEIWFGDFLNDHMAYAPYIDNAQVCIFSEGAVNIPTEATGWYSNIQEITPEIIYQGSNSIKIQNMTNINSGTLGIDDSTASIITFNTSMPNIQIGDYIIDISTESANSAIFLKQLNTTQYVISCDSVGQYGYNINFSDFLICRGVYYFFMPWENNAAGQCSHSDGYFTRAYGPYSNTFGYATAAWNKTQFVLGEYNQYDIDGLCDNGYAGMTEFYSGSDRRGRYAFIIGNGTDNLHRSNALAVDWHGNLEVSGDIVLSDGKGLYSKDSTGRTFGMIADNGDNLWIGAGSSNFPHHTGANGFTYISSGYNTTNNTGNSTIYVSVPSLSGTTWSHIAYGVLHSGNFNNYALPLSGGTLTGNLVVGQTTDTVSRGVNARNSLGNIGLTVGTDGSHGLYSGTKGGFILYVTKDDNSTNSTLYVPRPLTVTGAVTVNGGIVGHNNTGKPVVSIDTNTARCSMLSASGSTTLQVTGQWNSSSYSVKNITVSSSDARLKENIEDATVKALPIINQIKVRAFDWKDEREDKHQKIGVVADELEKIDPKLAVGGGYDEDGSMNVKSVDTFYLIGYLTKGIQELSKENEELKKQISILDAKISYLLDKTK